MRLGLAIRPAADRKEKIAREAPIKQNVILVRTEVRPSKIHGRGLFAVEAVPAGTVVWRFDPSIDKIDAVPASEIFSWRTEHGYVMTGDNAKFINHSKTPNLVTTPGVDPVFAARDIAAGEELTESYDYDLDWPLYAASLR